MLRSLQGGLCQLVTFLERGACHFVTCLSKILFALCDLEHRSSDEVQRTEMLEP